MVRYGGPRFEFYFTEQFLNNEKVILKEDAQRVAFILRRREQQKAAEAEREAQKRRQEEEQKQVAAEAEVSRRETEKTLEAKKHRVSEKQRRFKELSTPVVHGGPLYGSGTYGRVMQPTSKGVPLPQGRSGAVYMPGCDRHRVVPRPPAADAHPPWIGSGTAWMVEEAEEKAKRRYLFASLRRDPATVHDRKQYIDGIERHHTRHASRNETDAQKEGAAADVIQKPTFREEVPHETTQAPSVFSHALSNEPIKALGTQHMETISMKEEVQSHLAAYGGRMAPPRPVARPPTPFDDMSLPELAVRLVRMQQRIQR
ncbi:hypothetical protein TraAM80_01962 [Trypanosoma rangeli]|uniref:Uncharacterized protein n=1 Tax=Trypanosoma rangeli TaxID=5698 RepID=A0A422NWQ4_TRYRA|nr:uncharacterized protein TraAM80_01962 [Trypanosoma rangeli]RNF09910.1 hypothetical protein TraAM80_01962 [Trypanosoma rangeli]|eukprot:RNF09910.1 hypothetical protein TraAM80_01962 [Trypanosoma rangeli]